MINKLKMNYKHIGLILFYSLLFIPIWGLTLLDTSTSNPFSIFVGLTYTAISIFIIKDSVLIISSKFLKILLFSAPLFYLGTAILKSQWNLYFLLHPILIAFIILIISYFFLKKLDLKSLFLVFFFSYFYAYHINPLFKDFSEANIFPIEKIEEKDINLDKPLSVYAFENNKKDTVHLKTEKPFTLVETWNESCGPCIEAMKDLQPLMDSLSPQVTHYYLYENGNKAGFVNKTKIFNYSRIQDKSKILLDVGNKFMVDSKMASYPYFLLFDKEGNLTDYFKGYDGRHKEYFVNRINKMINTH